MTSDTFKLYDLRVTVVEIRGRSVCGLSVGDWFEVRNSSRLVLPPDRHFCIYALASVLPLLPAKQRELESRLDEIPAHQEVVAYCRGPYCLFAVEAVERLRAHGFRATRLEDGITDWRARGMDVER